MHRNHDRGSSAAVEAAISVYPEPVQRLLKATRACHISTGLDPLFSGLHSHDKTEQEGFDTRGYKDIAHVAYPFHCDVKLTMPVMVLPPGIEPIVIVHELAHVLDYLLGFPENPKNFTAINDYAKTDDWECFAEAVSVRLAPAEYQKREDKWKREGYGWNQTADLTRDDVNFIDAVLERAALIVGE